MKKQINFPLLTSSLIVSFSLFTSPVIAAEPLRVLTFGDSNTWGWSPTAKGYPAERFTDQQRWSGVLEQALGENYQVVVDGMVGRTTNIDNSDPVGPVAVTDFNGSKALPASIARNAPTDLVVIMLGSNDLQVGRERKPAQVAKAAFDLADLAKSVTQPVFSIYDAPKVLVIAPPAFGDTSKTPLSSLFSAGEKLSQGLSKAFTEESKKRDSAFFDAADVVKTQGIDGIHMSLENHRQLGTALAKKITNMAGADQ